MKTLITISAIIAVVFGSPALLAPTIITAQSPILSQYHSQDTLGQYSYGYNGGSSAKVESKSIDGITRGSYSYVDGEGRLQTVEYTADAVNGFRAAATNLPKAPIDDTPEVIQAKAEHFRAFNEASRRSDNDNSNNQPIAAPYVALRSAAPGSFSYTINTPTLFAGPQLITSRSLPFTLQLNNPSPYYPIDTPEVAQAKIQHLKAVEEQKSRIAAATQ